MRHWAREAEVLVGRARAVHAALAAGCCAFLWSASAFAQVTGSVGAVSDYRYRGHSLSEGDPALQASVGYDAASGAYAGLFGSTTRYAWESGSQWIPYAGFARRDRQGRSWDAGLRYVHFTQVVGRYDYDYAEAHVGVAFERLTLRLHYAPDYYGATDNAYFEADFAWPLGERWRLVLHGGVSRSGTPERRPYYDDGDDGYYGDDPYETRYNPYANGDRTRLDVSAGLVFPTRVCDVQAAWHHVDGNGAAYAAPYDPTDRTVFVLGCIKRW